MQSDINPEYISIVKRKKHLAVTRMFFLIVFFPFFHVLPKKHRERGGYCTTKSKILKLSVSFHPWLRGSFLVLRRPFANVTIPFRSPPACRQPLVFIPLLWGLGRQLQATQRIVIAAKVNRHRTVKAVTSSTVSARQHERTPTNCRETALPGGVSPRPPPHLKTLTKGRGGEGRWGGMGACRGEVLHLLALLPKNSACCCEDCALD